MGVLKLFSSGDSNYGSSSGVNWAKGEPKPRHPLEPDPCNYSIISVDKIGKHYLVLLEYPNCTNYNGLKLCVYDKNPMTNNQCRRLDPHFLEKKQLRPGELTPIARFVPNAQGRALAREFLEFISGIR